MKGQLELFLFMDMDNAGYVRIGDRMWERRIDLGLPRVDVDQVNAIKETVFFLLMEIK